jgi:membrane-associated phospholipid phosphatase
VITASRFQKEQTMKPFSCGTSAAALILVLGSSPPIAHAREDGTRGGRPVDTMAPDNGTAVIEWNATALRLLTPATFVSTRILAMTHLAIYDSVIAITLDYEPYAVTVQAPTWTSADAAVASAAHEVLVNQLPARATDLDAAYAASLAAIPDGIPKTNGMALGEFVAGRIIALRSADVLGPATYSQPDAPGVWQPSGDGYNTGVVATTWPSLTPFALRSTRQFRAPPPPALTSIEYATNVNVTKSLGARFSTTRTPDQTAAALFWYENGQITFNALARDLATSHGLDLSQTARFFALLNVAMADGSMTVFDTKYAYNFWRPIAAIRGAATDGNDATVADPAWDSLLPLVAAHPEYTSQHAVIAAAAATVLTRFFGDHTTFTMSTGSAEANGVAPRTFHSFFEAAEENAASRVWLGWHFPMSVHMGTIQGRQVATFALNHILRPVRDDADGRDEQ